MGRIAMDIGCENLPLLGNEDGLYPCLVFKKTIGKFNPLN